MFLAKLAENAKLTNEEPAASCSKFGVRTFLGGLCEIKNILYDIFK